jgi:xylulokinase
MTNLFLGLDLGTSGCKLIAFDRFGQEIARAVRSYQVVNRGPGLFELDAEFVWAEAEACFRELNARSLPGSVRTLAISVLGEAIVPIDRNGIALALCPISADMRGVAEASALAEKFGGDWIYQATGQPLSPAPSLLKLMWWRKNRPDLVDKAWKFVCFGEFAIFRLGLPPTIDEGMAARTMAFDLGRMTWSRELLGVAGLGAENLAAVKPSGTILGSVAHDAAARLSLPDGVQVVLGGHDQPMGALGAGIVEPGTAMYSIGTTEAIAVVLDKRSSALGQHNIPCYPHVAPNLSIGLVGNQSGGRVLAWYREVMTIESQGRTDAVSLEHLMSLLRDGPPDWPLLLPHFAGSGSSINDHESLGALFGLRFETKRNDILLAVLEGITFEQALSLNALSDAAVPVNALRAVGGGARSALWLQMKADILNRPITQLATQDAPCLGAAILGQWAIDRQRPITDVVTAMVTTGPTFYPRSDRHLAHLERLDIYRAMYVALRPLARRLHASWARSSD